jgi:hypothetical protein
VKRCNGTPTNPEAAGRGRSTQLPLGFFLVMSWVGILASAMVVGWATRRSDPGPYLIATSLLMWLTAFGWWRARRDWDVYDLARCQTVPDGIVVASVTFCWVLWVEGSVASTFANAAARALIVLSMAWSEEVVFRGATLTAFLGFAHRKRSTLPAVVLSQAVFAACHAPVLGSSLLGASEWPVLVMAIGSAWVIGAVFAACALGGVGAPVRTMLHAVYNVVVSPG